MNTRIKATSSLIGLCVVTTIGLVSGCSTLNLDLGPPGTIGMQREKAVIHDPYPSTELGPPIVGGRPAGYDLPLPQAKSLQVNPHARPVGRGSFVQPYNGF